MGNIKNHQYVSKLLKKQETSSFTISETALPPSLRTLSFKYC